MKRIVCLSTAIVLVSGLAAGAQMSDTAAAPGSADADRAAVATIVMSALTQVKLCGLAEERSENFDVKSLCRKVSADSARTALAGMQLAHSIGASEVKFQPLPNTPDELDELRAYSGAEFDRQFLLGQIETDESDENSIRYAVEFASDTAVRRYESSLLPSVERHLLLAETALQTVSERNP